MINFNTVDNNLYVASASRTQVSETSQVSSQTASQVDKTYDANTNEYGDTFSKSRIIDNADGTVTAKTSDKELPKIDSLVGYTSSQVELFYLQGRISRYDYDTKMEQKAELLESDDATSDDTVDTNLSTSDQVEDNSNDQRIVKSDAKDTNTDKVESSKKAVDTNLDINEQLTNIISNINSEAIYQAYNVSDNPKIDWETLNNLSKGNEGGINTVWQFQLEV